MADLDDILRLNQSFYRAFAEHDFEAMDELWADTLPVSCIHPGWQALFGRSDVMMSWRDLMNAGPGTPIVPRAERVSLYRDTALVLCEEVLNGSAVLAAANLFVREDGEWRLAHHQASAVAPRPEAEPKRRLH